MDQFSNEETFEVEELSEDERRTRYAEITSLKSHKGWLALVDALKDKEAKTQKLAYLRIMSASFNEREADYMRGLMTGLRWARTAPVNAEKAWNRLNAKREDS